MPFIASSGRGLNGPDADLVGVRLQTILQVNRLANKRQKQHSIGPIWMLRLIRKNDSNEVDGGADQKK